MTAQFCAHTVEKVYWALVEGEIDPPRGACRDWLVHDERHRRVRVAAPGLPGAKEAGLRYRRLSQAAGASLLEVALDTGRKHQIRVQLAARAHPILGDRKYGSERAFAAGIALHARRLAIVHPVRGEPLAFEAPLPRSWAAFGLQG